MMMMRVTCDLLGFKHRVLYGPNRFNNMQVKKLNGTDTLLVDISRASFKSTLPLSKTFKLFIYAES